MSLSEVFMKKGKHLFGEMWLGTILQEQEPLTGWWILKHSMCADKSLQNSNVTFTNYGFRNEKVTDNALLHAAIQTDSGEYKT